jgi:prevent-host-death family protein
MPAGEFKARCLAVMDDVQRTGTPVVITKHGRPVAQLVPVDDRPASSFGWMHGTVEVTGDLIAAEPVWSLDAPVFPAR